MSNIFNTADTTAAYSSSDIRSNKAMAILAYLGILVLVPIFAAKDSPFARFHTNQGLALLLASIAFGVANMILSVIFAFLGPLVLLWTVVSWVVSLGLFALTVLGIVYAA